MEAEEPTLHFLPGDSKEDIEQEIALKRLMGLDPKRVPKSAIFGRETGYGLSIPNDAIPVTPTTYFNPDAAEFLINWMFEQSSETQAAIIAYLSDPDDEQRLKAAIRQIDKVTGHVSERVTLDETKKSPKNSFIAMILRVLPATEDELYKVARQEHKAKRPEAAVRQARRRLLSEGRIKMEGNVYVKT